MGARMNAKTGYTLVDEPEDTRVEETGLGTALRRGTGMAVSGLKAAADLPSNLANMAIGGAELLQKGLKKVHDVLPFTTVEPDEETSGRVPLPSEHIIDPIAKAILPKGYLEPKGAGEKALYEGAGDLVSLLMPVPGLGGMGFKKSLAAAGLGNMASWLTEGMPAQPYVKMGTMLAVSMSNPFKLKQYMKDVYKKAEDAIAPGALVRADKMDPIIESLEKQIKVGDPETPSKIFMKKRLDAIKEKIKEGYVPEYGTSAAATGTTAGKGFVTVEDAWKFKKDMNEFVMDKATPKQAVGDVKRLGHHWKQVLGEYGKENPTFYKHFLEADDIFAGIHEASYINKFLQDSINRKSVTLATGGLLLGGAMGAPHAGYGAAAIAGGMAVRGAVQGFEALKNSPAIRKYYAKVMAQAAKRSAPGVINAVGTLDRVMKKYEQENKPAYTLVE